MSPTVLIQEGIHPGSKGACTDERSLPDSIVILVLVKEQIWTARIFAFW